MNLTLPRDFESYNCFRKFKSLIGHHSTAHEKAVYVFVKLWTELGYQVDIHGGSGVFKNSERELFGDSIGDPAHFDKLVQSEVLIPSGEDWVCPMFTMTNRELDKDHIPFTARGRLVQNFNRKHAKLSKAATPFVAKLPPESWTLEGGATIKPDQMRRIVMLIKTIDSVLRLTDRLPENYTPGLIHDTLRVVTNYSDDKVTIIMRRLHIKKTTGMRRSTDYLLANFDEMVAKIMPDDGYVQWSRERANAGGLDR